MNRRNALKNLGLFTGGMLLFPSCDFSDEKASIVLNKLQINANQEALIKTIVGTLLPEGEISGGISAKCHNYIWVYIDECTSPEKQQKFIGGLNNFDVKTNQNFTKENSNNQQKILTNLFSENDSELSEFLNSIKDLSIFSYMNSEYIMTKEMPYTLVPGAGSYVTCKTINPNKKINSNA